MSASISVQDKLKQFLSIDAATVSATQLRKIENFVASKEVQAFIKNNNKKTVLGKFIAGLGKSKRTALVSSVIETVAEVKQVLSVVKALHDQKAQAPVKRMKFSAQKVSAKLNQVSAKPKKTRKPYAKPRNMPSSKPSRF